MIIISMKNKIIMVSLSALFAISLLTYGLQLYDSNIKGNTLVFAVVLIISGVIVWFTISRLFHPLVSLTNDLARLGQGDLTLELDNDSNDEIGQLSKIINRTVQNLRSLVGAVKINSQTIFTSSEQLSASTDAAGLMVGQVSQTTAEIAKGAEETGQMIQDAASRTIELNDLARSVSQEMHTVQQNAQAIEKAAAKGQSAVTRATEVIQSIADTTQTNAALAGNLSTKSQQVRKIVEMINTLAGQTNLLALNAAIEAARAGNHGRGFAVVAEEVRKLAEQSGQASAQIDAIIQNMLRDIDKVASEFGKTTVAVTNGVTIIHEANSSFSDINGHISTTVSKVISVAQLANKQAQASDSLQKAVEHVAAVAQQSVASTEMTAASAVEVDASVKDIAANAGSLYKVACKLWDAANKFKLA